MTASDKKAALPLLALMVIALEPFVIVALWRWYVVPFGVMALTWAHAFGLNLLITMFTWRYLGERDDDANWRAAVENLKLIALVSLLGWVVHFWMPR